MLGRDSARKLELLKIGLPSKINALETFKRGSKKLPKMKGIKLRVAWFIANTF